MDATRGAAMLAVVLSHSAWLFAGSGGEIEAWCKILGMVATPAFLLLSGMTCGHLLTSGTLPLAGQRVRLLDRGLFLILVFHPVLALTYMMMQVPPAVAMWGYFYITDAVGVGLIVAAAIGHGASSLSCLMAGLTLIALGWMGAFVFDLSPVTHRNLFRILIGIRDPENVDEGWIVPLIPYLGIFLAGFAAGIWYSRQHARGMAMRDIAAKCIRIGLLLVATAIALKVSWVLAQDHIESGKVQLWHDLTAPLQKLPPGPAYELFFGGAALLVFGLMCVASSASALRPVMSGIATIGRASLIAYLAEYWIIAIPAYGFGLRGGVGLWFAGLVTAVIAVSATCYVWDRKRGNRLFTLGLARMTPFVRRASAGT